VSAADAPVGGGSWPIKLWAPGPVALGLAGAALALLVIWSPVALVSLGPPPLAAARVLIAGCAGAVVLVSMVASPRSRRWELLVAGMVALGGLAVLVAVPDPVAVGVLLLLLGGLHATLPSRRSFAVRMRGPATAALLIGAASLCLHTSSAGAHHAAALAFGLAIAAAAGLAPYVQDVDPDEPAVSSCVGWAGFLAVPLALTLAYRVLPLSSDELAIFSVTLIGLGLVSLVWGTIGAWRAPQELEAWRDSFMADWGLVLVALGLGVAGPSGSDGRAAALLALLSIVLVRFPLFLWAREVVPVRDLPRGDARVAPTGTLNVLLGAAFTGAAPFAGFPVRLLLLRGATREAWPLAAVLLVAMVVWVAHAFRLGRSLGRPSGRLAVGAWLALTLSLALGLGAGALLAVGRLG
jgi:hypothetical protein